MFEAFAARRDGKVKNSSAQVELLKKYYANKANAFTEAVAKTQNDYWNKQAKMDDAAMQKRISHVNDSFGRAQHNFNEEVDLNLKEAYRQLGYNPVIPRSTGPVYAVQVTTTGWCNVDRYVVASTQTRTTLNYTDPQSGKKAVIRYEGFSVNIDQRNQYDRLYVYLLPNRLNSFMRVNEVNGKFSEKLNELIKYDLICIGYKDEQAYVYSQQQTEAKDYSNVSLDKISEEDFIQRLNSIGSQSQSIELRQENNYFRFEITDVKRQQRNMAMRELTSRIAKVIFTCYNWVRYADELTPLTDQSKSVSP